MVDHLSPVVRDREVLGEPPSHLVRRDLLRAIGVGEHIGDLANCPAALVVGEAEEVATWRDVCQTTGGLIVPVRALPPGGAFGAGAFSCVLGAAVRLADDTAA